LTVLNQNFCFEQPPQRLAKNRLFIAQPGVNEYKGGTRLCVQYLLQNEQGPTRVVRPIPLLLAAFVAALPRPALAHEMLKTYVLHNVNLTINTQHVDLTLELTFFEQWSAKERLNMDTDGDGHITRRETDAYAKQLAYHLAQQVRLTVAGREQVLTSLYDPEVDLLGDDKVEPAHHRLRLFFFAPKPAGIKAGDSIVVEDSLWPNASALGTLQVQSHDGGSFQTKELDDFSRILAAPDDARRFTFRCLRPAAAKPNDLTQHTAQSTTQRAP